MYHLLYELSSLLIKNINNRLIAPYPHRRIKLSRKFSSNFIGGSKDIETNGVSKLVPI